MFKNNSIKLYVCLIWRAGIWNIWAFIFMKTVAKLIIGVTVIVCLC